jgi:hypothetical protein
MVKPIAIEFDGHTLAGVLFDDRAPDICNRIWQALPLEGQTTNTIWSGDMLRLWVQIPETERQENIAGLHNPGDILFIPGWNGLRFVYGQARMQGPSGAHPVPLVGRLHGDLTGLAEFGRRIEWEGAKSLRVTRR